MKSHVKGKVSMKRCSSVRSTRHLLSEKNLGFNLFIYFIFISTVSFVPTLCEINPEIVFRINKCCPHHQKYENNGCVNTELGTTAQVFKKIFSFVDPQMEHNISEASHQEPSQTHLLKDRVWIALKISMPDCQSYEIIEKIIPHDSSSDALFTIHDRDYVTWTDDLHFMHNIRYDDFCLEQINETSFIALICKPACSDKKPCVRKCCDPDSVLEMQTMSCVHSGTKWAPNFYNNSVDKPLKNDSLRQINYIYGLPNCSLTYHISEREYPQDKMYTFVNSSMVTTNRGRQIFHPPDTYCVDGNASALPLTSTHWNPLDQIAVICFPEDYEEEFLEEDPVHSNSMHEIGTFVTIFFLTLTAIVYLALWKHLNIHDWLQFAYVVSSLIAFILLGIINRNVHAMSENLCIAMGTLLHFWFPCTYFWFTSMTLNFWWTFRGCQSSSLILPNVGGTRRFCVLTLFSFGSAGIISATWFILELLHTNDVDSTVPPRILDGICYLFLHKEHDKYLYGVLICCLLIDITIFVFTLYLLYKIRRQEARIATQGILIREKKSFIVFARFFVLVGVLWIMEPLSWFVLRRSVGNVSHIIDIIVTWQGVLIFIILICRPDIYRRLKSNKRTIQLLENEEPSMVFSPI